MKTPFLVDTHAHVNFNAFKDDAEEVIERALAQNVWMNLVGSQRDTSKRAVSMAEKYNKGVYAVVGLHPTHLFSTYVDEEEINFHTKEEDFGVDYYRELAKNEKTVAIGEMGLEYYRLSDITRQTGASEGEIKEKQKELFLKGVDLACELDLPVVIHCRDAHEDQQKIIRESQNKYGGKVRGVVHCFSENWEIAKGYLDLGFLLSFSGIITFEIRKSSRSAAEALLEVVRKIPPSMFMLDTDCPYLTPEPYRGKRNEPLYVRYIAERVAETRGVSFEEVSEITTQNALKLFRYVR